MSDESSRSEILAVSGAAGQLGRRTVAHLLETERVAASRLVAVTRDPAGLADLAAQGVSVRRGDFDDPASLGPAFAGVDRLLLISTNTLEPPGVRLAQHQAAVAAAKAAGIKHVVYTSMPNPDSSVIPFAPDHLGTERALAQSGMGWTVLRNAWYFDNLFFTLPAVLASGTWYTAAGEGRAGNVSREDCARVAARLLASGPAANAIHDVTGPAALTTAEIAAAISNALGRPIDVVQVSDEELVQGLIGAGFPEGLARIWASFDTNIRLGKFDLVTDAVQKLTGNPPETLRDFLSAHKDALQASGENAA